LGDRTKIRQRHQCLINGDLGLIVADYRTALVSTTILVHSRTKWIHQ